MSGLVGRPRTLRLDGLEGKVLWRILLEAEGGTDGELVEVCERIASKVLSAPREDPAVELLKRAVAEGGLKYQTRTEIQAFINEVSP